MTENRKKNIIQPMNKNKFKEFVKNPKNYWLIALFVSLIMAIACCFFFSSGLSPLYAAWNDDFVNIDSNFFMYEGYLICQGEVPYIDFHDHKGLFHVYLNALGWAIGGRIGVLVVEILFVWATFFVTLLAVKELCGPSWKYGLIAVLVNLFFHAACLLSNTEGVYVAPFVALAMLFYFRGFKKERDCDFFLASMFAGLEMGLSLCSRPLDGIWGGALCIAYFVYWCYHKRNLNLLYCVLFALTGLLIPFAIFVPIAMKGGYLDLMIKATFVQSGNYASRIVINLDFFLARAVVIAIFVFAIVFYVLEKKKKDAPIIANFFFVTTAFTSVIFLIIIKYFSHLFSGMPFYGIAVAYACYRFPLKIKDKIEVPHIISAALLFGSSLLALIMPIAYYTSSIADFSYEKNKQEAAYFLSIVPENERGQKGNVFILDGEATAYLILGAKPGNKYFLNQSWWAEDNSEVITSVEAYLSSDDRPKYVFFCYKEREESYFSDELAAYYSPINNGVTSNKYKAFIDTRYA